MYIPVTGEEEGTKPADENEEAEPETGNGQTAILYEAKIIQKYMEDHKIPKKTSLLEGMQLHQEIRRKLAKEAYKNKIKEYADFLTYGKSRDFIYQEFLSARTIINFGVVYGKRETGRLKGIKGELAFVGKNAGGEYEPIKALSRIVKNIAEEDSVLYAETLVTVPNRISIKKGDVEKYRDMLISRLPNGSIKPDAEDKMANEFIMALGYSDGNIDENDNDNDKIIRMQCEIFSDKLPRLLQYVIYCRAYRKLEKQVDFFDGDDIEPDCVNKDELCNEYGKLLKSYGIEELDEDLTPAEDVITDCRPYLKAVPYYQGIKPEFLCRMINTLLKMGGRQECTFIDAFGGSGTVSMNMDSVLLLKQSYNDMGIFNKAFFSVVKDDDRSAGLKKIRSFIDIVLEYGGGEKKKEKESSFFASYKEMLDCMAGKECGKYLDEPLEIIYGEYKKSYNNAVEDLIKKDKGQKHDSWKSRKKLDERLSEKDRKYYAVLQEVLSNPKIINEKKIRGIEENLFAAMKKVHRIFDVLKGCSISDLSNKCGRAEKSMETDLALIFFLEFTFSERHFHSSATIGSFSSMIGNYERDIDRCKKIFSEIEVYGEDASALMKEKEKAEDENTVWYCDIPYSETDARTYAASWFDEKGFVESLSGCKGDYIVASRFNIPERKKKQKGCASAGENQAGQDDANRQKDCVSAGENQEEQDDANRQKDCVSAGENQEEQDDTYRQKELNIIKSFSRFVTEEFAERHKDLVEKKYGKRGNEWSHISDDRKAEYVVFAFTLTGQNNKGYFKKTSSLSQDAVRRMFRDTQIGSVSVEIMMTNMKLNLKHMPVHEVKGGGKMWHMPVFKTASAYWVEPVTIIMKYEDFMEEIVLGLLSKNLRETMNAREYAAAYHKLLQKFE